MPPQTQYLFAYNVTALISWTCITILAIRHLVSNTTTSDLHPLLQIVTIAQTAALLEIAHAAFGLVHASPIATGLQAGGRNLVLWTVVRRAPEQLLSGVRGRTAFLACVAAWGVADGLRYALFAMKGKGKGGAKGRYSAFVVLYPIGFVSEATLVYLRLIQAWETSGPLYTGYLSLGLLAYIPVSYVLYTHMLAQRRRALQLKQRVK
ncbi:PTPLA-domain-containing protein [Nemania sp. FL0916]|nr:PTPLA-domain-containing protein [Nemania sp. FL0916]